MSELRLNIYEGGNSKHAIKTFRAEGYDLMLGTVEDIMEVIDIDKAQDKTELAKMVVSGYRKLMPLIKDIFPEITEEELRKVKIKELIPLFFDIAKNIAEDLELLQQKNQERVRVTAHPYMNYSSSYR